MRTASMIRAGWVSLCLFAFAAVSLAQSAPNPSPPSLQIAYTGRLLGYFRVSAKQARDKSQGCPNLAGVNSEAANTFLKTRDLYRGAVLVGTGDNFSPQLEARTFAAGSGLGAGGYETRNKELYSWDRAKEEWVHIGPGEGEALQALLALGEGTIPTDNVGCFLAAAGFSAVVPGKHDFYFGSERVRQLARFMAGIGQPGYQPVQMLGANLVIQTTRLDGNTAPAATEDWPTNLSAQNLKKVYPWFSAPISLKLTPPKGEKFRKKLKDWHEKHPGGIEGLAEFLSEQAKDPSNDADEKEEWKDLSETVTALDSVYVCPSGEFNEVSTEVCRARGYPLKREGVTVSETDYSLTYSFSVEKKDRAASGGKAGHYSTFEPGKRYGLCLREQPQTGGEKGDVEKQCTVFSVQSPFFLYPHRVPSSGDAKAGPDPDPFVFLPNASPAHETAIFGVVDPHLSEQVGVLNFSWRNIDEKLKSAVVVEDPAEALTQQLAYFEQWYKERHGAGGGQPFSGLKILLAQMSPQRARLLATRFPEFQVVVAGADQGQATDEIEQSIVWAPKPRSRAFIAVPTPSFDTAKEEVVVSMGLINASNVGNDWRLSAERAASPAREVIKIENERKKKEEEERKRAAAAKEKERQKSDEFSRRLRERLADCVTNSPAEYPSADDPSVDEPLKLLTLCAMRQRMGADVALLQKRDFFTSQIPPDANKVGEFQSILDHVIWKGDLLTLMYVPGSALRNALDQSKKYEQEEADALSLTDDRSRGLLTLGVETKGNDYIVNELPLDDKKIYAVATTDYIGAGDTGYPDFGAAALVQKKHPAQFPSRLETVSGVVCRKLLSAADEYKANCLPELKRDEYLDPLTADAAPPQRPIGLGKMILNLNPFKLPEETKDPETLGEAGERNAQRHPIWTFSLQNLSLGFNHTSRNLTDKEVKEQFAGVPISAVNTSKFQRTMSIGLGTRFSRLTHLNEFFLAGGLDLKDQKTGDGTGEEHPAVTRTNNRITVEAGWIRNLRGGRSANRLGINLSVRAETPFLRPFTNFDLSTKTGDKPDRLTVRQGRSLSILPRAGLRRQNGANSFEAGFQFGGELRALRSYEFETQGVLAECLPSPVETFAKCVTRLNKLTPPTITKDSVGRAILANRPRAGAYWRLNLAIPFNDKVKYEVKHEGDFFFNFSGDNATDTRQLENSNHSLKFSVWPSLSFGPTMQLLYYRNKVEGNHLFQRNLGFETTFSFDIFNRRERKAQAKRKSAAAGQ